MSDDIQKIGGEDTEKIGQEGDSDFEGHKLGDNKLEPKVEPDFEGHKLGDGKLEPKLEPRFEG